MKRLSIAEAAQQLGVSQEAIKDRISKNKLVACQTPGFRDHVWIRQTSAQIALEGSEDGEQALAEVKRDLAEVRLLLEAVTLRDLTQKIADLQHRVEHLEAIIAAGTPVEGGLPSLCLDQEEGATQSRKKKTR